MQNSTIRAGLRGTLVALAALLLVPAFAAPAQAQDAYRYWSYWWGAEGSWEYAQSGPADRVVKDGDVEGWLFLVSAEAVPAERPATAPDFAAICTGGAPAAGQVRVAVVIDYGSPQAAPQGSQAPQDDAGKGECVTLPAGSTGEQALAAAADVRAEQGATCGINGYPATGCFDVVTQSAVPIAEESAQPVAEVEPESDSSSTWIWLITIVVVVAVMPAIASSAIKKRKQRKQQKDSPAA